MNDILHKLNLLSPEEFQQIVEYKENIVNKGKGAITINEHGEYSINTDASSVFIGSIFNYQYTIEGFEPYMGKPFVNIFNIIQNFQTSRLRLMLIGKMELNNCFPIRGNPK